MPTINFPTAPSLNDVYSFGGKSWKYNGTGWALSPVTIGAGMLVAASAPSNPPTGTSWFDLESGTTYIWVDDGTSAAWIEDGPSSPIATITADAVVTTPSGSIVASNLQAALIELDAEKASLVANTFTGSQKGTIVPITSTTASIAINLASSNHFSYTTTEDSTLAAPTNPIGGQSGVITITQGAAARLLAYNTFWKFAGGTVPTLTATVGAIDTLAYYVESATRATCQLIKDVK